MSEVHDRADRIAQATTPLPIDARSGERAVARWQADHAAGGAVISAPFWRTTPYAFGQPNVRRLLARHTDVVATALEEDVMEIGDGYGMARGRTHIVVAPLQAGPWTIAGLWDTRAGVLEILPWTADAAPPATLQIAPAPPIRQTTGYLLVRDQECRIVDLGAMRALHDGVHAAGRAKRLARTLGMISAWTLTRDTHDEDLRVRPVQVVALALQAGRWQAGGASARALREQITARTPAPHAEATRALARLNPQGSSSFAESLRAVLARPWLRAGDTAILGAAAATVEPERPCSRHTGTLGQREAFTATVTRVVAGQAQEYGWTPRSLVLAATDTGAVLRWRTGRPPQVGERVQLRGRVQAHTEYAGTLQTELGNVRLS